MKDMITFASLYFVYYVYFVYLYPIRKDSPICQFAWYRGVPMG